MVVAEPSLAPQLALVPVAVANGALLLFKVIEADCVHPLLSVAVTLYVPPPRLEILFVVELLDHI